MRPQATKIHPHAGASEKARMGISIASGASNNVSRAMERKTRTRSVDNTKYDTQTQTGTTPINVA